MLKLRIRSMSSRGAHTSETDKLGFSGGNALDGDEHQHEEDRQYSEAFGSTCLWRWSLATVSPSVACCTYNHSVVPSKDGELIQARDQIPASCDVSGQEDAECED